MSLPAPPSTESTAPAASSASSPEAAGKSWTIIVGVVLVCLLALGGGYWFLNRGAGSAPADAEPLTNVMSDSPPGLYRGMWRGGQRPPGNRNNPLRALANRLVAAMPDGVSPTGTGYLVRAGTARLDVTKNGAGTKDGIGKFNYRFSYAGETLVSPEEAADLMAANHAREADKAKAAGVTPQQVEKLRAVPGNGQIVVDPTDRAEIEKLFMTWLSAAGQSAATSQPSAVPIPPAATPAETALTDALSTLGKKQLGATKQAMSERAKAFHAILGDAAIAKLK